MQSTRCVQLELRLNMIFLLTLLDLYLTVSMQVSAFQAQHNPSTENLLVNCETMIPRSRKRSSIHSEGPPQAYEPPTKRLRSWKKKHSALMELPTEIRLKILSELLWQKEPLKIIREAGDQWKPRIEGSWNEFPVSLPRESNFDFHPAVLRTCRTICEEGTPILYDNTIACEIWCDFNTVISDEPHQSLFLRPDWNIGGIAPPRKGTSYGRRFCSPWTLMSRVKKLDVVVRVQADDECSCTRQAVRMFIRGAKDLSHLSELSIRLEMAPEPRTRLGLASWTYENEEISSQDYQDFALGPFALMRGLKSVTFRGISTDIAEELTKMMTSEAPVVDLPRMYDAMRTYMAKRLHFEHCRKCRDAFRWADRADHEADMEDERAFRKSRSKIFAIIAQHERRDLTTACRYDPEPRLGLPASRPISDIEIDEYDDTDSDDEDGWLERELFKDNFRNEEAAEDRDFRREQEKERPSLVRLREVVCKERAYTIY